MFDLAGGSSLSPEQFFVKKQKNLQKSVDKWKQVWYYNQAVARKNVSDRVQKKDSKKSKKTLDKQETVWYNNQVAERKKFRWKSTKDLEN